MEKSKYPQREKIEKQRHRLPFRNDTEQCNDGGSSSNMMDRNRKSKILDHSFTKSLTKESNEVAKEPENISRSLKEEKKLAFRLYSKKKKQEAKKERQKEKQKEREDRILQKIIGPKGESISFIDSDTFHKISSPSAASTSSLQTSISLSIDKFTFPDLGQGLKKSPRKPFAGCGSHTVPERVKVGVEDPAYAEKKTKSRKKKDPVVVDILKAIEICKVEKQPNKKSDVVGIAKKSDSSVSRIVGNILDSSNPLRHRGKKREVPRKRNMTRLKKAVILERERRRAQKDSNMPSKKINTFTCTNQSKAGNEILTIKGELNISQEPYPEGLENIEQIKIEPSDDDLCDDTSGEINQEVVNASKEISNVDSMVKERMHSRKFREYCNHSKRQDLSEAVTLIVQEIVRFQDRAHINQPIKAESHRRYVLGLRQSHNLLSVQKVKIIILASDIERVPSPGGLDDLVTSIIDHANKQNVPVIFNFQRRQLGKLTYRKVPVSCIGILNYQGTEAAFQKMTAALENARRDYIEKFENEKSKIMNDLGIPNIKVENIIPKEESVEPESDITLPLLKKLTEAISEVSLQSSLKLD